tara:strand:- start:208 stop:375 length:168 start_codon:yes stop_codon:yes gene_type:complete
MTPLFLINGLFNQIMTSGEALWHDIDQGKIAQSKFLRLKERKVMHWPGRRGCALN